MRSIVRTLEDIPLVLRCALIGCFSLGAVGMIAGLVLGLSYPPTVVVAIIEGGLLGAIPGAVLGLLAGVVAYAARGVARR